MVASMTDRYMVWAEDRPHAQRATSSWLRAHWWYVFRMGIPATLRGKRMIVWRAA